MQDAAVMVLQAAISLSPAFPAGRITECQLSASLSLGYKNPTAGAAGLRGWDSPVQLSLRALTATIPYPVGPHTN